MGIWGGLIYLAFAMAILVVIQWYIKAEGGRNGRSGSLLLDMPDTDAAGDLKPSQATGRKSAKPAARFRPS